MRILESWYSPEAWKCDHYGFAANGKATFIMVQRIQFRPKSVPIGWTLLHGIWSGWLTINVAWSNSKKWFFWSGDQFAFIGCMDAESDESISQLIYFILGLDVTVKKVALDPDLGNRLKISEHCSPEFFQRDGQKLFFWLAKIFLRNMPIVCLTLLFWMKSG